MFDILVKFVKFPDSLQNLLVSAAFNKIEEEITKIYTSIYS